MAGDYSPASPLYAQRISILKRYIILAAAIINLFRVYAHGLPDTGGILYGTGHDLFRHCNTS